MVPARYASAPASWRLPPRERPSANGTKIVTLADGQPLTIRRLRELKPGQTFVYYRGHFAFDLERCELKSPYHMLLLRIRSEAAMLEARGRIRLSEVRCRDEGDQPFFEYVATGV